MTDFEKIEPAVGSLLDPANVGKRVLVVWNGNWKHATPETITHVSKACVFAARNARPVRYRVRPHDQGVGNATVNGYTQTVCTVEWAEAEAERKELMLLVTGRARWGVSVEVLREFVARMREAGVLPAEGSEWR